MFSFDGSTITVEQSAKNSHYTVSMGNLRNTPFAVGGRSSNNKIVEAKFFDEWIVLGEFPFAETYYQQYSTLTFQDELYYIG